MIGHDMVNMSNMSIHNDNDMYFINSSNQNLVGESLNKIDSREINVALHNNFLQKHVKS